MIEAKNIRSFLGVVFLSCSLQGQDSYTYGEVVFVSEGKIPMFQDHTGFLWGFDKEGSLLRFDGYEFHEIRDHSDNSKRDCFQPWFDPDIDDSETIMEDNDQKLWILSLPCSMVQYDPKENTLTDYQDVLAEVSGLKEPFLFTSYKDERGDLWWGSQMGLFHFSTTTRDFEFFKLDTLGEVRIMSLLEDQKGFLWCRHDLGFSKFDRKQKQFLEHVTVPEGEYDDSFVHPTDIWTFISTLRIGNQDRFLFLGLKQSIYFDVAKKELVKLPTPWPPEKYLQQDFVKGRYVSWVPQKVIYGR